MSDPSQPEPAPALPAEGAANASAGTRRTAIIAVTALVVTAILSGGAFAVWKVFFNGGPQPAEALPASTMAVVSIDLNPAAGQKVEGVRTMRKFPELKKRVGLNTDDDLRKFIFDKATDNGKRCPDLDYDKDIAPWIGKRAALAAVDLGEKDPAPAIALQVSDTKAANSAMAKIKKCASSSDGGSGSSTSADDLEYAAGSGYLILSDSQKHADKIVSEAKAHPLAEDAGYRKWTKSAGDSGVLNFYVAKSAATYFIDKFASDLGGSVTSDGSTDYLKNASKDFTGLAGSLRFADGGMELSMVSGGVKGITGSGTVGSQLGELPEDTAVVIGLGVPRDFAENTMNQFAGVMGSEFDSFIRQAESETGMDLPDDLQSLLGESITLSLGGDAPASFDDLAGPADLPAGLLVKGDETKIDAVITKIEKHLGTSLADQDIAVVKGSGKLAIGFDADYTKSLLDKGSLASSANFKRAVPNASSVSGVFYLDFDSKWVDTLVSAISQDDVKDAAKVRDNLKPLEAFGASTWRDGDLSHVLVKITTN